MKKLLGILVLGLLWCGNVNAAEPITFSNIKSRIKDIPEVAWSNTQNLLNSNRAKSSSLVDLEIHVGPKTKLYFKDNEKAFKDVIALWANVKQPRKYLALFYSFKDKSWALSKYNDKNLINAPCWKNKCTGANSSLMDYPDNDLGVGVFGIYSKDRSDPYRKGAIQIHEYTHAVQAAQWMPMATPTGLHQRFSPCWLTEGQAHFAGLSASSSSFNKYKIIRKKQIKGHPVKEFRKFTLETILDYYNNDYAEQCIRNPRYKLGYTLGLLTVEALSAIGGTESTMKLYENAAEDKKLFLLTPDKQFNKVFKDVYGISWDEAKPILAEVVTLTRKK